MVMWNLVGQGIKLAVRGIDAFSRTEAGKKTAEFSASAFAITKERARELLSDVGARVQTTSSPNSDVGTFTSGERVILNGRRGTMIRYLTNRELGVPPHDDSPTTLACVEMDSFADPMDRYMITADSALRRL
jgi:hypothetical protein